MSEKEKETETLEVEPKDVFFLFICRLNERFSLISDAELYCIAEYLEIDMEKVVEDEPE